jgi:MATE family multidrug resistance protein
MKPPQSTDFSFAYDRACGKPGSEPGPPSLWSRPAGYRDVLTIAVPLILSTGSWSVQHFVDRMFLCWYSTEAMAAASFAGSLAFSILCFFSGIVSYVNTFVAQYHGAGRPHRIGSVICHGIYLSALVGLLLPALIPRSGFLFGLVGHAPELQSLERTFFNIIMAGVFFSLYNGALSCFFTGLGRVWPATWVTLGVVVVNLILDYALIFGNWGMPEMGIAGAAWATVTANAAGSIAYTILVFRPVNRARFALDSGWRFDPGLMIRLFRFGAPNGAQFFMDMLSFTFFLLFVGGIGEVEGEATVLAFQVNTVAFMPMIGFGIAASTLVGQSLCRNQPHLAARATWSAFHLTFAYMATVAVLYVLVPSWFIYLFAVKADPEKMKAIYPIAVNILYFIAVYSLFDTMNLVFAGALKGAGDTFFVMLMSWGLTVMIVIVPISIASVFFHCGLYTAWAFFSLYVILLGFGFLFRFLQGKWRTMRVIEASAPALPPLLPEAPTVE